MVRMVGQKGNLEREGLWYALARKGRALIRSVQRNEKGAPCVPARVWFSLTLLFPA